MGIRSYFRDVRERLVHIEDKTDGISSNVQSSSEDIQAVTATVKHVNENCVDSRERLIHVENKENDIRDRVIHIEDKVDKLLSRDSEKMYTGFLPDGLETAESRGGVTGKQLNIVFSTTRQWNPGDEFILRGVMSILRYLGIHFNPIIYNRNPDIHSQFDMKFRASHVPTGFNEDERQRNLEAVLKFGMFDNSVKPDTDLSFVDWVIFAGTPEWCNGRNKDLYELIIKYQLPVLILGVGGGVDIYKEKYKEVIQKAKLITVREHTTQRALAEKGISSTFMTCPSILSAPKAYEKQIYRCSTIALIYQATVRESVLWNGSSEDLYKFELEFYKRIIEQYGSYMKIFMVCHYIDEVPLAYRDFPDMDIRYSYDSADYYDIYHNADLVIGPRVHGIGVSASMLIPGIAILHDARGETCEGFHAKTINIQSGSDSAMKSVREVVGKVPELNRNLYAHKHNTMVEYVSTVGEAMMDRDVHYDCESDVNDKKYNLKEVKASDIGL